MLIENKQRLVGIIVLAVFVALLIPFLFVGNSGKNNQTPKVADNINVTTVPGNNTAVNLPEQTMAANYTMPAPQNAMPTEMSPAAPVAPVTPVAPAATAQVAPQQQPVMPIQTTTTIDTTPVPSPVVNQTAPVIAPTAQPGTPAPGMNMPQPAPVANLPVTQPVTTPANIAPRTSQPVAAKAPVQSAPVVAAPPTVSAVKPVVQAVATESPVVVSKPLQKAVVAKHKATTTGAHLVWAVQVGSFANQQHVNHVVAELKAKGFHGMTQKVKTSHGTLTRIVVGEEPTREQAMKLADKLEKNIHLKGTVVRIKQ